MRGIGKQNQLLSPNPDVAEKQKAKSCPEGKSYSRQETDQASVTDFSLLNLLTFLCTILKCVYEAMHFQHISLLSPPPTTLGFRLGWA